MKKMMTAIFMVGFMANLFALDGETYVGEKESGKICTLTTAPPIPGQYLTVMMRAQIGGPGIPFFLGGNRSTTENHIFNMMKLPYQRIVSTASKVDPVLEIFAMNLSQVSNVVGYSISGYKVIMGKTFSRTREVIKCNNLILHRSSH